jgi:hypothetical protein
MYYVKIYHDSGVDEVGAPFMWPYCIIIYKAINRYIWIWVTDSKFEIFKKMVEDKKYIILYSAHPDLDVRFLSKLMLYQPHVDLTTYKMEPVFKDSFMGGERFWNEI